MAKLRVFEAFAGYGSQSLALRNIGIDYEVVAISEIDKYALQAYYLLHDNDIPNLGDISKIKVEDIPDHDLFTYSFPCQDISVAGKMQGLEKGKTRSGLLYECEKIIENKKPKYLLMENVKNLVGKKFKPKFDEWCKYLESLGYTNYYKILDAKDFGLPQSRKRVFMISILGDHIPYEFPKELNIDICLKDILEDEDSIDEKFIMNVTNRRIVLEKKNNIIGFLEYSTKTNKKHQSNVLVDINSISPTINATDYCNPIKILINNRVRKLTNKEYFKLQGMNNEDINKISSSNISRTQQYKMAGNSIAIPVLEEIFKQLFL